MREKQQYKTVAITYSDDKPLEFILLVTDISYHDYYIKVEYRETIHKDGVKIIAMRDIKNIAITELDESDVKSLIIGRTGMKDIKVNVNGGKYDND